MPDVTNELMYELLKRIHDRLTRLEDGQHRIEADLRSVKSHMGDFLHAEARHDGELADLRQRITRIERRLDIVD